MSRDVSWFNAKTEVPQTPLPLSKQPFDMSKSLNKPLCYSRRKGFRMCLSWCTKSWSVAVVVRLHQYCKCLKGSWRSGGSCCQDLSQVVTFTHCHVLSPLEACCSSCVFVKVSFPLQGRLPSEGCSFSESPNRTRQETTAALSSMANVSLHSLNRGVFF